MQKPCANIDSMNGDRVEQLDQCLRVGLRGPRTLAGLIGMYENNWTELLRLVPELDRVEGTTVSSVSGAMDLYLTVLERARYTTSIALTYHFDAARSDAAEPNARICVYHDARMVELVSHCRRKRLTGVQPWRTGYAPDLYRRWEMNRFLLKWLRFCGHQGHLFLRATTRRLDPSGVAARN